eukprot:Gb_41534 [translate_table: standard]
MVMGIRRVSTSSDGSALVGILKIAHGLMKPISYPYQLDLLSSKGCIEDDVIDLEGHVFHEYIFCAKCKPQDIIPDNDIILCDGAYNCGFHKKCLDSPSATKNIPGDQDWIYNVCKCKLEGLEAINAYLGTHFIVDKSWEDIFVEEASIANGENACWNQRRMRSSYFMKWVELFP